MDKRFCIYITNKRNGTIYIGVTNDLARRVYEHREGLVHGFTTRYGLKMLVHYEVFDSISLAIQRETSLKRWPRRWKLARLPQHVMAALRGGHPGQRTREARSTVRGEGHENGKTKKWPYLSPVLSAADDSSKWWANSKTVWGTLITAARPRPGHHPTGGRHHDLRQPGDDGGSGSGGIIWNGARDLRPA